jgi:hypothetical protein
VKWHACSDRQDAARGTVPGQPALRWLLLLHSVEHGDPVNRCSGELLDERGLDEARVAQQTSDLCAIYVTK